MELLKIELLKVKKSSLLLLALIIPIPVVLIVMKRIQVMGSMNGISLNEEIFIFSAIAYLSLLLPLQNIYTACVITKVENDNCGWKQLMLLPIKKSSIYFSKYKVMIVTLITSILSYFTCIVLSEFYLSKNLSFNFQLLSYALQIFITTLPILILLFIIGRNFSSIIPLISIGVIMLITNIFIAQSRFWVYAPWTYSMMIVGGNISSFERYITLVVSILLSIAMFSLDFIRFTKSDIK
ncbi:ABC transporter permease [Clostridium tertium]|uniref:ABC transporter permease n=1 Tax=Clostridium tertium TaxID=1559 RepID=UPI00291C37C9|nr:ABC transporter permease [Clostridium sp.]